MRSRLPLLFALPVLLGACLWVGWLVQTHLSGRASLLDRAETVLLDLRILVIGQRKPPDDVVIVAIDDRTVTAAGRYPIGRDKLAGLVEKIRLAGARSLAIDILLIEETTRADDERLAEAISKVPAVIAAAGQFESKISGSATLPTPDTVLYPLHVFKSVARTGLVNLATDAGGTPRHVPVVFTTGTGPEPSFVLAAVAAHLGEMPSLAHNALNIGDRQQPLDFALHMPLNYYGPGGTVRTISAQTVLDGGEPGKPLDGRLVLVGTTAVGVGDKFGTPFDQIMPGVEVMATGIANLLDGSALVRNGTVRWIDAIAAVLLTAGALATLIVLPLSHATVLYLLSLAVWMVAITAGFMQGFWLSGALPVAASLPPVVLLAIVKQVYDRRQARRFEVATDALSRFHAPDLANRIAEDPDFLLRPVEQDAAILFVDLAGFTGLSERMGPVRTRDILKTFHTLVVNETVGNNGVVLDFMGDGAMICFGITGARPGNADDAVRCAFDLVAAVRGWIASSGLNLDITDVRVGGHFGPVVLSRLGHDSQQQIAATGDCVNVASRLMEAGKSFQTSVALSQTLMSAAGSCKPVPPRMETVVIRGRRQDIQAGLWTSEEACALSSSNFAAG
ncbi:CHASE2 domain-containing protein [Roseibium salinum]|uniref:Adenylate/guanylate cyclase domain-containing protein n=1 Tax=Roseibium salinum TaxID=1604349 RepID=A0ABT3R325_9HYPH|nr:adenylate/guanylate cyclase domain-containing protein [Roseibium sp. DSM 29163]MCX2723613.1 adenylate/guanylate cyclase domain-containing protein [Roseibium sp. DSM 29163]